MPEVVLNGESCSMPEGATVADAVRRSGVSSDGRGVAAALDGEVVVRGAWDATVLGTAARVEVLQAVQGG